MATANPPLPLLTLPVHMYGAANTSAELSNPGFYGMYYATVQVGKPRRPFSLQLDTGSSNLLVRAHRSLPGEGCKPPSKLLWMPATNVIQVAPQTRSAIPLAERACLVRQLAGEKCSGCNLHLRRYSPRASTSGSMVGCTDVRCSGACAADCGGACSNLSGRCCTTATDATEQNHGRVPTWVSGSHQQRRQPERGCFFQQSYADQTVAAGESLPTGRDLSAQSPAGFDLRVALGYT
jgi:hypothetical protein